MCTTTPTFDYNENVEDETKTKTKRWNGKSAHTNWPKKDNRRMNGTELTRRDLIWREIDVALSSKCPLLHYLLNQKNGEENTRRVEAFVWRQATTTKKRKKMFQLNVMCLVSHVDRHTFARSAESRGCRAPLPHTNTRLLSGWINAAERQANARNKKVTAKNATEEMKQNESYCVMSCCAHDRFKRIAVIIVAPLPLSQFLVCVCVWCTS